MLAGKYRILIAVLFLLCTISLVHARCPSDCECLTDANAKETFGEGNYVKCSEEVCGYEYVKTPLAVLTVEKYCFKKIKAVDNDPPQVDITYSPGSPTTADKLTFTATATDPNGISKIEILVNARLVKTCTASSCTYTGGPYPAGTVTYLANAWDTSGNLASTGYLSLKVVTIIDRDLPSVDISHFPSSPTTADQVTFTATASDPGGIREIEILVNARKEKTCTASSCTYMGGPYPAGTVTYAATATDESGNIASTGYQGLNVIPVTVTPVDQDPPQVDISYSPPYPSDRDQVTFRATASDSSGIDKIEIYVFRLGERRTTPVKTCTLTTSCQYTGGPYRIGFMAYATEAYDTEGNIGSTNDKALQVRAYEEPPTKPPLSCLNDDDDDGVYNCVDNCVSISNSDQRDRDQDGVGDVCDQCDSQVECDRISGLWRPSFMDCSGYSIINADPSWATSYHEEFYDRISQNGCGCKDTDGGGSQYFTKGAVYIENVTAGAGLAPGGSACYSVTKCEQSAEDTCTSHINETSGSQTYLREYSCGEQGPESTVIQCPFGCSDGACACPDSDRGFDPYNRGTLSGSSDYCLDTNRLMEYQCGVANAVENSIVPCDFGCQNGACVCSDSDGGENDEVKGNIGTNEDYCKGMRDLVEYYPRLEDGTCKVFNKTIMCAGLCEDGGCLPPTCSDGIKNYHDDQWEEDIDCGGSCGISCDNIKIEGYLMYQDADAGLSGNVATEFKPIREIDVWLYEVGKLYRTKVVVTNESGYFYFIIPRSLDLQYYLKFWSVNSAANVQRDFDACNEYVWWESEKFTIPQSGNVNLGELRVGVTSADNSGVRGYWQERYQCFLGICWCGSDRYDLITENSAYFNIAETSLQIQEYALDNRAPGEEDTIGRVDILYPENVDIAKTNTFWNEIYLKNIGRDDGFFDSVIFHEYTHHLQYQISSIHWSGGHHTKCMVSSPRFAWLEGFPEYMEAFMTHEHRGPPYNVSQVLELYTFCENPFTDPTCTANLNNDLGRSVEGAVCSLLWDLADGINEPHDTISGEDGMIFQIFDKDIDDISVLGYVSEAASEAPDICDFIDAWNSRYRGTTKEISIIPIVEEYHINCSNYVIGLPQG